MPATDFLIIGQGIAGTLISYELCRAGRSFVVIDQPGITNASHVAGAVINPVNINSRTIVANSEIYIPAAIDRYRDMEAMMGVPLIKEKPMLVCAPGNCLRTTQADFRSIAPDEKEYLSRCFYPPDEWWKLGVWQVESHSLLRWWRKYLQENGLLLEAFFDNSQLILHPDHIQYKDITAGAIVFCEGAAVRDNPLFASLPFNRNRGEALLLQVPELDPSCIYHNRVRLVPVEGLFWCGSNYTWHYENLQPDESWRTQTLDFLKSWLRLPFTVKGHLVAERPTTAGQELMVGQHPQHPAVYLFNGLGTKGFSMGPFLAKELSQRFIEFSADPVPFVRPLHTWIQGDHLP